MWLGTFLFIAVCLCQAGYAIVNVIAGNIGDVDSQTAVAQFEVAGLVASTAAIYNVHVVESSFHYHLETYYPLLKFLSVKIMVSLCYIQKYGLVFIQQLNSWQPGTDRSLTRKVPVLGDVLNFSDVEFSIFYSALLMYECLISAASFMGMVSK